MRFFKFLAVQVVVGLLPVVIVVSANLHVPFNEVTKASVSIDHDHQQSAIALLSKTFYMLENTASIQVNIVFPKMVIEGLPHLYSVRSEEI